MEQENLTKEKLIKQQNEELDQYHKETTLLLEQREKLEQEK